MEDIFYILPTYDILFFRFVFCYKCLHKSLMVESRCPVTKLPATMHDMIRIYSDT